MKRIDSPPRKPTVSSPKSASAGKPASKPAPAKAPPASTPRGWTADPARKAAAARAAEVLGGGLVNRQSGRNSLINRDGADVNDGSGRNPKSLHYQQAQAASGQLKGEETRALASLPPPAQARYTAVLNAGGQSDPVLRLSMQQLLLSGKLEQKDSHGRPLLETLATLSDAKTPLAKGLSRATLVNELAQELANPTAIDQAQRNTCGPTTVAIFTAMTRPAEYARLVAGLASPDGKVDLVQGALSRVATTTTDDGSRRSTVQRLLEPALMDFGNGRLGYDNMKDKHTIGGLPTVPGALPSMVSRMLTGIMGRDSHSTLNLLGHPGKQDVAQLERLTAGGMPVPVMTDYKKEGLVPEYHWLLATKVTPTQVTYVNPWGREETMPRAEFNQRLKGMSLPG